MAARVLVTGSSGRVGKACMAHLNKAGGMQVVAASRTLDDQKVAFLNKIGAHEVVEFDLKRPETWEPALKNVDTIFSSSMDALLPNHQEFAKFLGTKKNSLQHVVRISCFGADTNTASYIQDQHVTVDGAPIPLMLQHYWWGEECLLRQGLPLTVIRGNFYMNHLLKNETENIKNGWFQSPLGTTRNSFVCTNDMGEAAAHCIRAGPKHHADKYYDITGPQAQNMFEIAADLSDAIGQKVEYRPTDMDQFRADFGPARAEFVEYLRNGFYTRCSPDFFNLLGKKPTSYKQYLTEKGPFGETGVDELFSSAGAIFTKGVDAFADLKNFKQA